MRFVIVAFLLLTAVTSAVAENVVRHRLAVELWPEQGRIAVTDRVELPRPPADPVCWTMAAGFEPQVDDARLPTEPVAGGAQQRLCVRLEPGRRHLNLRYAGTLSQVTPDGVYLDGDGGWFPRLVDAAGREPLLSFSLQVTLPDGWWSVSQGALTDRRAAAGRAQDTWREPQPQETIYLIAAPFELTAATGEIATLVMLRRPDPALARRYLDATGQYLDFYSQLLGDYPYAKFALVENLQQTGYGMPSFTLLGSRVLRLPFILTSSYPHEILHNWWGNGVYVDPDGGNWAEGLTTYLADYLAQEVRGSGARFRRERLQRYGDYVHTSAVQVATLAQFRARHDGPSQALGYDKGMMFFHGLRRRLGDAAFIEGLRRFFREQRFRRAGYRELRAALAPGGEFLDDYFAQWLNRADVPELALSEVRAAPDNTLSVELRQIQPGPAYRLRVPLALQLAGRAAVWQTELLLDSKRQTFVLTPPAAAERLAVDPQFDLMRRLAPGEVPVVFSALFGAERPLWVLPAAAGGERLAAYRELVGQWQGRFGGEVTTDAELGRLPAGRAVWLFGWDNTLRQRLTPLLAGLPLTTGPGALHFTAERADLDRARHGVALVVDDPATRQPVGWLAWDDPVGLAALARKLPHYGKYSYLGFGGAQAHNLLNGQWPARGSPLAKTLSPGLAGEPWRARFIQRPPLAAMPLPGR